MNLVIIYCKERKNWNSLSWRLPEKTRHLPVQRSLGRFMCRTGESLVSDRASTKSGFAIRIVLWLP